MVKTQDEAGGHYEVSGTLREKPKGVFLLEPGTIGQSHVDGSGDSAGPPVNLGKLGEGFGWGYYAGIGYMSEDVLVTRK
jgi:hypothetical protein